MTRLCTLSSWSVIQWNLQRRLFGIKFWKICLWSQTNHVIIHSSTANCFFFFFFVIQISLMISSEPKMELRAFSHYTLQRVVVVRVHSSVYVLRRLEDRPMSARWMRTATCPWNQKHLTWEERRSDIRRRIQQERGWWGDFKAIQHWLLCNCFQICTGMMMSWSKKKKKHMVKTPLMWQNESIWLPCTSPK